MLIDSHAHLTCEDFAEDLNVVLERAQEASVSQIVNICTTIEELKQGIEVSQKYPHIFNVASTTPHDADKVDDSVFDTFAEYARNGFLCAIGETGLDYHYEFSPRVAQRKLLEKYMKLALNLDLSIVIHCREAFSDFFSIFEGYPGKVLLHCFTGTLEDAESAIERGYFLSLSGIVTFKKSVVLQDVAKILPLNQLVIETDSPYLAPQKHRGKRNEPAYLKEIALYLSQLKEVSFEEIAVSTASNARKIFNL